MGKVPSISKKRQVILDGVNSSEYLRSKQVYTVCTELEPRLAKAVEGGKKKENGLTLVWWSGADLERHIEPLSEVVAAISADGFGLPNRMTPSRLGHRLLREGNLILAFDSSLQPVGFQMQTVFHRDGERLCTIQE